MLNIGHTLALLNALQAVQGANSNAVNGVNGYGADQVGGLGGGGWSGFDILGGRVGSAGLLDVVGSLSQASQVAQLANPLAGRALFSNALANLAGQQAVDPSRVIDAAALLGQPVGLPQGAVMGADVPRVARKQYIALGDRQNLNPNASVTITALPQSVARIERLVIESIGAATASGKDFVVSRLDVGDMRQISGAGELPGTMFESQGFQLDNKLDTSNPGNQIIITITNVSAGAIVIAAGAVGTVIR